MDYSLSQEDGGKLYIEVMETPYSVIRVDNIAGEQVITVYNVPLSHIDDLIVKLQGLKTANQPKTTLISATLVTPYPVAPAKIIDLDEEYTHLNLDMFTPEQEPDKRLEDDEPEIMTEVLGQKPDPTGWYRRALETSTKEQMRRIELPTPPMPQAKRGKSILTITGVPSKPYRAHGYNLPAKPNENYNADIVKNKSIRIYGIGDTRQTYDKATNTFTSQKPAFDLTFDIGSQAVYGSYNLIYTGTITAIGEKTVKIEKYGKTHQLDLHTFISRNWDYDAHKIFKQNSEWQD
jgi:hypothetical protein